MNSLPRRRFRRASVVAAGGLMLGALLFAATLAAAPQSPPAPEPHRGGEANLILPDLSQANFIGINARVLLFMGLVVCALGLAFALVIYRQLKTLPVHVSMRDISELIYETCKTYLITQ